MTDALREALEHQQRALRAGLEGDEGVCAAALACGLGACIAALSQQSESLARLSARVQTLEAERGERKP